MITKTRKTVFAGIAALALSISMGVGVAQSAGAATIGHHKQSRLLSESGTASPRVSSAALIYSHCSSYSNVAKKWNANEFAQIPVNGTDFNCILESGNNNSGVAALQNHMNSCYGKSLTVDGVFGPATYSALLQVQSAIGVTVDGVYGPGTRAAMNFFASDLTCNPITSYVGF